MPNYFQHFIINFLSAWALVPIALGSAPGPVQSIDQDDQASLLSHHLSPRHVRSRTSVYRRSHHAPPNPNAIQCGDGFGTYDIPDPRNISCKNYGGVTYSCLKHDCHVGQKMDPITRSNRVPPNLIFWDCQKYTGKFGNNDHIDESHYHAVVAQRFWPDNDKGVLAVLGWDASVRTFVVEGYRCQWDLQNDWDNVRPYCNTCELWTPPK